MTPDLESMTMVSGSMIPAFRAGKRPKAIEVG